jgi:ubiquinone/menaquinone biosynthesis C-methylase UbiE
MAMIGRMGELAAKHVLKLAPNARVVDFCCGTGLSLEKVVKTQAFNDLIGVDNSAEYLHFARQHFAGFDKQPRFIQADAVDVPLTAGTFDCITLSSAYHHIEDARKFAFLKKVRALLSSQGRVFVAENLLPFYRDSSEYAGAVRLFYQEVLKTARGENPNLPKHVEGLIERVAKYGVDGDYEYKVHKQIFLDHVVKVGLVVVQEEQVWPAESERRELLKGGGNFVYILQANE